LVAAYSDDPSRFEQLGLTANSPAWRLKHAGFSVAHAYAQQAPPRYMTSEGKRLRRIRQRDTAFKLGDSIIGTGLAAVPAVGGALSEGYQEVKENLEALGWIAHKGSSAAVAIAKRIFRRDAPPSPEPVTAEG
jgi:hypothetical protein